MTTASRCSTTDGEQVVTIQDSGIEGALAHDADGDGLVTRDVLRAGTAGTYVYDLGREDASCAWATRCRRGASAAHRHPGGQVCCGRPRHGRKGATQVARRAGSTDPTRTCAKAAASRSGDGGLRVVLVVMQWSRWLSGRARGRDRPRPRAPRPRASRRSASRS